MTIQWKKSRKESSTETSLRNTQTTTRSQPYRQCRSTCFRQATWTNYTKLASAVRTWVRAHLSWYTWKKTWRIWQPRYHYLFLPVSLQWAMGDMCARQYWHWCSNLGVSCPSRSSVCKIRLNGSIRSGLLICGIDRHTKNIRAEKKKSRDRECTDATCHSCCCQSLNNVCQF